MLMKPGGETLWKIDALAGCMGHGLNENKTKDAAIQSLKKTANSVSDYNLLGAGRGVLF